VQWTHPLSGFQQSGQSPIGLGCILHGLGCVLHGLGHNHTAAGATATIWPGVALETMVGVP
jgi:hypothetical protein